MLPDSNLENPKPALSQLEKRKVEHRAVCAGITAVRSTSLTESDSPLAPTSIRPLPLPKPIFHKYRCNGAINLVRAAEAVPVPADLDPLSSINPGNRGRKGSL